MRRQSFDHQTSEPKYNTILLPILVGVLLSILTAGFSWVLHEREQANLHTSIEGENIRMAGYIDADLRMRVDAIERLVKQWETQGGFTKEEFTPIIQAYINDMPGFQAIEYVDPDFYVRWIVPYSGNEKAQDLNLGLEENRRLALETAKNLNAPSITAAIDLVQGGKGFLVYFPITSKDTFEGFILAVFRVETWLTYTLDNGQPQQNQEDLRIAVSMEDIPVYQQPGWADLGASSLEALTTVKILGHRFIIQSRPTPGYIQRTRTYVSEIVLLIGLLVSILIAVLIGLFQRANSETWRTHAAKLALEAEIQGHQATASELQETLTRLDMATKAGGIGVWSWDLETNILAWNERMYYLFDIPPGITPVYETWRSSVHPDDLRAVELLLQNAVQGRALFNTEYRILLPSAVERYLGAAARVERDPNGKAHSVNGIVWDLTDLKMAENEIKKNEEQVRLLLNSTAEAIYGIDLAGNCTFANPSCLKILGYTDASQLLGKRMHDLIHHSYADGSPMLFEECHISRALRESNNLHRDDEVLWRVDNTSFPVEYWSYPQILDGKVSGAVVTFIDITERKRAQELLATERHRLADILEGTNAGTWEWNVQTGATVFNERWAAIIGYTLDEIMPVSIDTWVRFTHPDDLKISQDMLQKHFSGEMDYYYCEVRMLHKNGSWVWVLDRGRISSWTEDGKPLLMSGTHQDITPQKTIENDLLQSESQNRALLSAIPDLILRIRRDGTVLDYKASADTIEFIKPERIVGRAIADLVDEQTFAEARRCIDLALLNGQVQSMEFNLKLSESLRTFECRFKNAGPDDVIAIIRDISERARLEHMKSDFINRATHDLRTPITTILLMVNLIEGGTSEDEYKEYWNILKSEVNRERQLVEDLLSAGRLESDRYQFSFRLIDVTDILKQVLHPVSMTAKDKNIDLSLEITAGEDPALYTVKADATALTQVFMNLVSNAIKFTPVGGSVRVVLQRSGAGVQVSIIDTGIGIPAEDMPLLFNRFFRGSNAVDQEIQGSGIGLYIVRSILDKHAGRIQVKSEKGKGSQFDVWLPQVETIE